MSCHREVVARVEQRPDSYCSCCGVGGLSWTVRVSNPESLRPLECARWCPKCVRAVASAVTDGKEYRRRPNDYALVLKRFTPREPTKCAHSGRALIGEALVALWHGKSGGIVCVRCIEDMVAALGTAVTEVRA